MFDIDPVFDYSEFSDDEIECALSEIEDYYKKPYVLRDGVIRGIADWALESSVYAGNMPYSQCLRLAQESLFQEVANRWIASSKSRTT